MLLFFLLTIISLASAIPVTELDGRNDLNNECKAGKRGIRKEWLVKLLNAPYFQPSNSVIGAN